MREEASPKQWEKLYEVTCNLKALEPWKYFWDTQLVAIFLKDSEEPVFASIMGCGGNCYGISVYEMCIRDRILQSVRGSVTKWQFLPSTNVMTV